VKGEVTPNGPVSKVFFRGPTPATGEKQTGTGISKERAQAQESPLRQEKKKERQVAKARLKKKSVRVPICERAPVFRGRGET